jgi:hypothetical protein
VLARQFPREVNVFVDHLVIERRPPQHGQILVGCRRQFALRVDTKRLPLLGGKEQLGGGTTVDRVMHHRKGTDVQVEG